MRTGLFLADRTAVLFLGVAAGAAIGYAFAGGGKAPPAPPIAPPTVARTAAVPSVTAPSPASPDIAQECALPFQPHLLQAVAAGDPVTVGVFGDSFGDGVWSALYRLLPAREKYRVIKYSQQSTGFTRYASRNVEEHAAAQIAADGPVDVAVISFGANDTQGVYANGHAAALMSPDWQRIVGGRIDGFVRLMRSRGAVVYWLGLPKMRAAAFDADIAAMNAFYERRMKALQVPFIDIRPLTVDAAGDYAPYLPDPNSHEMRLMRANDGIHMSMNGYVAITRTLAERIKAYVAAARVMAGVVPEAPAPIAPRPAPVEKVVRPSPPPMPAPKPRPKPPVELPETHKATPQAEPKPKPRPEADAPVRPRDDSPATKPKVETASPRPKVDAPASAKPKAETPIPPRVKPEAQPPAKPKAEVPPVAKPKPETQPGATKADTKVKADAKPKGDASPSTKPSADRPTTTRPATVPTVKPPIAPAPRPPLQLNLPPPEESRRSPSAPPPIDQP
jgi:hypothetical protein